MAARTVIPTRSTGDSPALHLADHLKMHAEYNKFAVPLAKTTSYTLVPDQDGLVTFDGASLVATLPTPVGAGGESFIIKNLNASLLTVATTAATIDGLSVRLLKQYDSIRVTSNDTYWVSQGGISSSFQSTTAFGLPTTSGRSDGDLHFDRSAQREYTLISGTWVNTSGSVNSIGSGLPGFAGRVAGDHHFDSTGLKDYVLTGLAGATAGDSFNRTALGTTDETGRAYTAVGTAGEGTISGNRFVSSNANGTSTGRLVNIGSGVNLDVSIDVVMLDQYLDHATIYLGCNSGGTGGHSVAINSGYNAGNHNGGALQINKASGGGQLSGNPDHGNSIDTPGTGLDVVTLRATLSSDGKTISVYRNGVLKFQLTDSVAAGGTYVGFSLTAGSTPTTSYIDNFSAVATGTLAWTPGSSGPTSTVGYGLPTTTGRSEGDLHFNKSGNREYTLVSVAGTLAWSLTSGTTTTVGAGLPGFAGRVAGDEHFETTSGKLYVCTGAAGTSISDDFNRANTSGQTWGTSSSGGTWNASGQFATVQSNRGQLASISPLGLQMFQAGAGPQTVAAGYVSGFAATLVAESSTAAPGGSSGYQLRIDTSTWQLLRSGTAVVSIPFTSFAGSKGNSSVWAASLSVNTTTGVITYTIDGTSFTYTDSSPFSGAYAGFLTGSTNTTTTWDDVSVQSDGNLAWNLGAPAGPTSTVGLGVPTTTGRSAGDLHYDTVAGREYTLTVSSGVAAWAGSSGAVNTSAAGLPGFTGRVPGDHAFDTTTMRDYVLTGAPGVSYTDSFSGADGALTTTESGGLTYSADAQGMAVRVGNRATGVVSAYRGSYANVGSGAAQEISADVTAIAASSEVHLMLRASSNGSAGYDISIESNRIKIGRGAITGSALLTSVAGAPAAGRYTATVDASQTAPTVSVYRNGVLIAAYTDGSSPQTGNYVGFGFNSNTSFIDNVSAFAVGTLVWSVGQSSAETIKHIAASGAAVTVDNPITTGTTITRAVLSANCTFTLPAPGTAGTTVGKSFTVVVVQAASGGPYTATFTVPSGSVLWGAAGTPTQSTGASNGDMYVFTDVGGGNLIGTYAQGFV